LAARHALNLKEPVAWIARPCQYLRKGEANRCGKKYWSSHRFSEYVINSINQAVDQLKEKSKRSKVVLIGFSGGGAVAALVAARRSDVAGVVTIAGNLDHKWVNSHHGVTQLSGSLNPINIATRLSTTPQIHFVGKKDKVIPSQVATRFIKRGSADLCAEKILVDATHLKGWVERWRLLLDRWLTSPLKCLAVS
jgi:dienelactone hydrolase